MAEYIYKDEAFAIIENKQREICPMGRYSRNAVYGSDREAFDNWQEILDEIEAIQPADVAPVRHARWVDNHCTACGMMPMGDEMWKHLDLEPPLFERFMDYCPSCGCRMDG